MGETLPSLTLIQHGDWLCGRDPALPVQTPPKSQLLFSHADSHGSLWLPFLPSLASFFLAHSTFSDLLMGPLWGAGGSVPFSVKKHIFPSAAFLLRFIVNLSGAGG